ncbi:MAG: hypothetical protein AB7R90_01615 [Reyranellaceae bacterium]
MGRVILILLALFAAPTAAWFAWRWLQQQRRRPPEPSAESPPDPSPSDPPPAERWQDAPWTWLILAGLALAIAAVLGYGIFEPRDCTPVPTQMIDGKLVPAHCE